MIFCFQFTGETVERDRFLGLYAQLAPTFTSLNPSGNKIIFPQGSDELFIGRAGYLCGLYELRKITSEVGLDFSIHKSSFYIPSSIWARL